MQRRLIPKAVSILVLLTFSTLVHPVLAADHHNASNWSQRDRAVYVVSTLNLLHTRGGHLLTSMLEHKFGVSRYDVYSDKQVVNLYFIEAKKADGSSVGALAYQMGWLMPLSLSATLDKLHVRHASSSASSAYRDDAKQLIGSFTTTVPS